MFEITRTQSRFLPRRRTTAIIRPPQYDADGQKRSEIGSTRTTLVWDPSFLRAGSGDYLQGRS